MSRDIGIFSLSGNYEPNIKAPLDARTRVTLKSDLTDANAWGTIATYLYDGLLVSVSGDSEENNGVYRLKNSKAYGDATSWEKIGASELPDNLVTYTDIGNNRKSVVLANYDSISGYGTGDLADQAFNLVMLSKWNKADFGSTGVELNLNAPDAKVTVNDTYSVVLDKDIMDVVRYSDIGEGRHSIMLANHDTISGYGANFEGTDLSQQAFNLIMVSKWNKADVGSPGIQMNLNSPNADVTVNDQYHIMLDKDMANYVAKSDYDELVAQVAELKATVNSLTNALEAQHAQLLAVGEN